MKQKEGSLKGSLFAVTKGFSRKSGITLRIKRSAPLRGASAILPATF